MAITLADSDVGSAANGADVTLTFTALQNDIVILIGGNSTAGTSDGNYGPVTAGYTQIADMARSSTANPEQQSGAWYKIMGASPDASVVGQGKGAATSSACYAAVVLRGIDTTTPMDTAAVLSATATTDGSAMDPSSITTVTDGAWVLAVGIDCHNAGELIGITAAPTGYTDVPLLAISENDNHDITLGVAGKAVASAGAEDPGAFTDDYTTNRWEAFTIAVRPAGAGGGGSSTSPNALRMNAGTRGNLGVNMTTR